MLTPKSLFLTVCVFLSYTLILTSSMALEQRIMVVQVKEAQIRSTPSFLGKIMARSVYGEKVTVMTEKKGWMKVRKNAAPGVEGWVHGSALSAVKIILKSGDKSSARNSSNPEVALAGKGFNEKIEEGYATSHQTLNYSWVDKMEIISPKLEELEQFIVDGNLSIENGGNDELP